MENIQSNLNKLLQTKSDIKQAIQNKGVEVSESDTFASYAEKISSIPQEGGVIPVSALDFGSIEYGYAPTYLKEWLDYSKDFYDKVMSGEVKVWTQDYPELRFMPKFPPMSVNFGAGVTTYFPNLIIWPNIDLSNWLNLNGFSQLPQIQSIHLKNLDYSSKSIASLFNGDTSLVDLQFENCNFGNSTSANSIFKECSELREVDLTVFNLDNIETLYSAFDSCKKLKSIKGINAVMSLSNIEHTFDGCSSLEELDLSNWDVSKCTRFYYTFTDCGIKKLNVSTWKTDSLTSLYDCFYGCSNLTELDLSSWDVSKVTSINNGLRSMTSLETLNLSGWNLESCTTWSNWILANTNLKNIIGPIYNISGDTDLKSATMLTSDSINVIIEGLKDGANKKLTLSKAIELTDEQKQKISNKGWTLTQS